MRGEILFEKMTEISDEYVAEAALTPATKRGRFASLSRVLNSGRGVACICLVVAIAAVIGMVVWGRMGTVGPGSDPSVRFTFSYEMKTIDGSAWDGTALPGDIVNVETTIVNHGYSFESYDFFAYAHFVLQGDDSITVEGVYPVDEQIKEVIETNRMGTRFFSFQIPETATPGVYDLVLSYDGVQQVYKGVLTVGETTSAGDTNPFSFGYGLFEGNPVVGSILYLETWVVNDGEAFTFEGSSMGFLPTATLVHGASGYRIEGMFDVTTDFVEVTVNTGNTGICTQAFIIPADAPTGEYTLVLSYEGESAAFEGVVNIRKEYSSNDLDELWKIAEQYIPQVVTNIDSSYYGRGGSTSSSDGYYKFTFCIEILGTRTKEELIIVLDKDGTYLSYEQDPQTYSLFIPYITEELVEATKPPLYEYPDAPIREDHRYGYTIQDGDLYLTYACYDPEIVGECYYYTTVFLYPNPNGVDTPVPDETITETKLARVENIHRQYTKFLYADPE